MAKFVDNEDRNWVIAISVADVKRVRTLLGVNLNSLVDDGFAGLQKLISDPVDLVDVVYVLCKPQCDAAGVTDEDFGQAMAGDAVMRARDAFLESFSDFFADPRVREMLKKLLAAGKDLNDRMLARAAEHLDAIDLDSLEQELIGSSSASPASSESTPDPSPSAS